MEVSYFTKPQHPHMETSMKIFCQDNGKTIYSTDHMFFFKSIALFCEKKRNWIQTQNQADNRIAFVHSFAKTKRSRLTSLTFPGARQPRFVFPIFKSLRYWIIFSSPQGYRVSRKISDGKHKCKLPYKGFHFIIN